MAQLQHGKRERFITEALSEARAGFAEGGFPVGAVLVKDDHVLGRGRNRFQQTGDPTSHAEMEAYRDGARRLAHDHTPDQVRERLLEAEVYTTMMPCEMCAGAIVRFGARRVVVAEELTYDPAPTRHWLEQRGIEVVVLESPACIAFTGAALGEPAGNR